jgi:hypothetical protein
MDQTHRLPQRICGYRLLRRGGHPWSIFPRDDSPSGQPAVDGSTEQAQPPAARAEHHILEAEADAGTDVDGVAESRQSSAAPTTATAAILALITGDRSVKHPKKTGC